MMHSNTLQNCRVRNRKNLPLSAPSMALTDDLNSLEELINGLNYVTMLEVHDVVHDSAADPASIVRRCITDSDPIGFAPINTDELIDAVSRCVLYAGHTGHGPDKGTFDRPEFTDLFAKVQTDLRELCSASSPHRFSFRFGRTYSPIFWGFSFLLHGKEKSSVLVGASWD